MKFGGLQKLTLLDFPGTVACTLFTIGCNYRCPFCHNATLVTHTADADQIDESEILSFLKKRAGVLEGVAVTGGEPLLWPELPDFLEKVKSLGFRVKLDTNGSFPERLAECLARKIPDYVAIDIKNCREKYAVTAGSDDALEKVEKSIEVLRHADIPYEFRTTVVKGMHTPSDIESLTAWIAHTPSYFLQNFTDSGDTIVSGFETFTEAELQELLEAAKKHIPHTGLRGV